MNVTNKPMNQISIISRPTNDNSHSPNHNQRQQQQKKNCLEHKFIPIYSLAMA